MLLGDAPGLDLLSQLGVPVYLGHAQRRVGAVGGVVVVPVVFECLPECGGAVETGYAQGRELADVAAPGDAEQMQLGAGFEDRAHFLEAGEDLRGLEGHHAADGDAAVADLLQFADC